MAATAQNTSLLSPKKQQPPPLTRARVSIVSTVPARIKDSDSNSGRLLTARTGVHLFYDLPTRIKQLAADAGFDLCGIAPVRNFSEQDVFPAWIADGKHGEMKYMEARDDAGELKRASLARVAPWARSVVVCAINYNTAHPYSTEPYSTEAGTEVTSRGWISRYAWGGEDYHDAVPRRLRKVENGLRELLAGSDRDTLQLRSYVDTGPLIERLYAKYAGVGWIGKNTCIINQQLGSWLFLGVILTSLDLAKDDLAAG